MEQSVVTECQSRKQTVTSDCTETGPQTVGLRLSVDLGTHQGDDSHSACWCVR